MKIHKISQHRLYCFVVLLGCFSMVVGCTGKQPDLGEAKTTYINQEEAISNAIGYCSTGNLESLADPYNIEASMMPLGEAFGYATGSFWRSLPPPSTVVWVISMDGAWLIHGPPNEPGTDYPPGKQQHCMVVSNASTGSRIMQSSGRYKEHASFLSLEKEIYAQIITEVIEPQDIYVIEESTDCLIETRQPENFKKTLLETENQTLADYIAKLDRSKSLENHFVDRENFVVINEADYWIDMTPDVIPYCSGPGSLSLDTLQKDFPAAQGVIHLSSIGFSNDKKQALVCVGMNIGGCHKKVAIVLLNQDNGNWKVHSAFQIEQIP